jgi:hypothetical protein
VILVPSGFPDVMKTALLLFSFFFVGFAKQ